MRPEYEVSFYDSSKNLINCVGLNWNMTHNPATIHEVWENMCFKDYTKKDFVQSLQDKMNSFDINSEEFRKLLRVLSDIVNDECFVHATHIYIS
jgi:hypothetical protein